MMRTNQSKRFLKSIEILILILSASAVLMLSCTGKKHYPPGAEGVMPMSEEDSKELLSTYNSYEKVDIKTDGLLSREGAADGHIVIHKFADFNCPYCYEMGKILQRAQKRWPGRITVYYRQFPFGSSCNPQVVDMELNGSCIGTQVALCSAGKPNFSEIYHGIFDFQASKTPITIESLETLVNARGGNWSEIISCIESGRADELLKRDLKDSEMLKIVSTPTIIVNNKRFPRGMPNEDVFMFTLDALVYERDGKAAFPEL